MRRVAVFLNLLTHATRSIATGFAKYANERGNWSVIFAHQTDVIIGESNFDDLDGMIAGYVWEKRPLVQCPVVYVHTPYGPNAAPTVCTDNVAIGKMAASHLVSLGLPHFGIAGVKPNPFSVERLNGFRDALIEFRQPPPQSFLFSDWQEMLQGAHLMKAWLSQIRLPCAMFCADDRIASVVAFSARELGIDVPEQLAILGANDDDLACTAIVPSLSSIGIDGERIGYEAGRELDKSLSGELPTRSTITRIPPKEVVQRGSTQVMGYDDPLACEAMRTIRRRAVCEPVVVDQIAAELGIHRQQLNRTILRCVGHSPKEEIDRIRRNHLRQLLQDTTLPLKQITSDMGFSSPSQLIRFCRRTLGETPLTVRESPKI